MLMSADDEEDGAHRSRRDSYTLSSPIFSSDMLPKISTESSESLDTVVSFQSIVDENDKSLKDLRNEIDKRSTASSSVYDSEPQCNNHLRELIERQKQEYLRAMETLKAKFTNEQHDLLVNLESNVIVTSTPLNSSMAPSITTDDEGFTEFKSCLQVQSLSQEEKTLVNDCDEVIEQLLFEKLALLTSENFQIKASIIINAFARGFLTRRLLKTIYVQEHIRNIKETLQLVLNLSDHNIGNSPVQNVLLKSKLFRQLQTDLYNFNEIFTNYSSKEKMKIIASDSDIRAKKEAEENKDSLSSSFKDLV